MSLPYITRLLEVKYIYRLFLLPYLSSTSSFTFLLQTLTPLPPLLTEDQVSNLNPFFKVCHPCFSVVVAKNYCPLDHFSILHINLLTTYCVLNIMQASWSKQVHRTQCLASKCLHLKLVYLGHHSFVRITTWNLSIFSSHYLQCPIKFFF